MNDSIERQDAIIQLSHNKNGDDDCDVIVQKDIETIKQLPSAQQERPKGHWVEIGDEPFDEWECDMCGFVIDGSGCINPEEYRDVYKFCPNCGADMRSGGHYVR